MASKVYTHSRITQGVRVACNQQALAAMDLAPADRLARNLVFVGSARSILHFHHRTVDRPIDGDPGQRLGLASARGIQHGPQCINRGNDMSTYIGLLTFTDKGIQSVKDTTKLAAAAMVWAKKFGVNMREIFWTTDEC